jgi:uncharacterized Fe-S cluster-containing protein
MGEGKTRIIQMPRLYNVFDIPKIRSVRATTALRSKIDTKKILSNIRRAHQIQTAKKKVVKFELRRGAYLLLFPSGYVEVRAPDEGSIREVLIAFRDELFRNGLIG